MLKSLIVVLAGALAATAGVIDQGLTIRQSINSVDQCPGYTACNVQKNGDQIVAADLQLAGPACNAYGTDLTDLKLVVEYQTSMSPSAGGCRLMADSYM